MKVYTLLEELPKIAKAIAAFIALLVPFLTIVGTSLSDGVVYANEWIAMGSAFSALIGGTKAVYQIRNKG